MLLHRVLSALIGIPILIFSVWYGGIYLTAVISVVIVAGILEYARLIEQLQVRAWLPGMVAGALLFVGSAMFPAHLKIELILTFIILLFLFRIIAGSSGYGLLDSATALFGTIYIGWFLSHFILMRQLEHGFYFVVLTLIATWMTDTVAYFVGKGIGKHKLAPSISPKKTIEGSIGGILGSVLGAVVFAFFVDELPLIHSAVLGLLIGVVGQIGDLIESSMKRKAGIKDSGNLIPGHGGVLDRFDSLLLTTPLVYYYVQVFILN